MKKYAEILVKCGYAEDNMVIDYEHLILKEIIDGRNVWRGADPFEDTLEGRRQADAIEDYLLKHHSKLWGRGRYNVTQGSQYNSEHRLRLDIIKWCVEQLGNEDEAM